jgi:glycosyltransferase involved in cell wall biosynthesis
VSDGDDGWLVAPDDEDELADALVAAVNDDDERRRRGERAYLSSRERYAWPALAGSVAQVYEDVRAGRRMSETVPGGLPDID